MSSFQDWDGSRALGALRERMNRLFDEQTAPGDGLDHPFAPAADVYTSSDGVTVSIELPGVPTDTIEIGVEHGELTVAGQRPLSADGIAYHRLERQHGEFRCTVALPADVDAESRRIRSEYGVLTIEIPRRVG